MSTQLDCLNTREMEKTPVSSSIYMTLNLNWTDILYCGHVQHRQLSIHAFASLIPLGTPTQLEGRLYSIP